MLLGSSSTNSVTGPRSSQHDLDSLIQKLGPYPLYKPITYFYHVTKLLPKVSITLTNELRGSEAKMTRPPSNQSPIHRKLSGIFFGCNLDKRGYSLPDRSPFGTERIKIPITEFSSSRIHLFYNSHHKTQNTVYYVILVLIKESDPKYQYCKDRMIELDMESNRILRLDFQRNKFEYCHPFGFSLWLEVFVVGNIQLGDISHSWDKVTDTGRHQSMPRVPRRRYHSTFDDFDDFFETALVSDDAIDDPLGYYYDSD